MGLFSVSASVIKLAWAPAQPRPQNSVTRLPLLSRLASASISASAGRTIGAAGSKPAFAEMPRLGAGLSPTSPGITTTATPRLPTAARMAFSST